MYEAYQLIVQFLMTCSVLFTIHEHILSYTVADAKACLFFPLERLLKTIAFRIRSRDYILATVRGSDRIDYCKLAATCGTKRTEVFRLAPEEVANAFGIEVGSVSPLLLREGARMLFDKRVPANETVFCGIGRPDQTLEIQLATLVKITNGQIVSLTSDGT